MTDKYITLVIKNPTQDRIKTFRLFEETEGVGEISALSVGHCLDILEDCTAFIEKLSNGEISNFDVQDEALEIKQKIDAKLKY
ncbi:hypothetical protein DM558_06405 [Entomomonas moraniae]|uniref:Uncharacterized protein n=1 Tax=Entomomonas moraniae TaxID=2213226 RepID=A0A3Q9JIR5_9GAMM|nr:hypothetical protein [Entomomonas moraniae]AZS50429.1 hypothetical protein DM558_06405 [Entomomonas moraniae]